MTLLQRLQEEEPGFILDRDIEAFVAKEEGFEPRAVPPAYTGSLDAKLPWENIISVDWCVDLCAEEGDRSGESWLALHRDDNGDDFEGRAKTEAQARRAAALKAKKND